MKMPKHLYFDLGLICMTISVSIMDKGIQRLHDYGHMRHLQLCTAMGVQLIQSRHVCAMGTDKGVHTCVKWRLNHDSTAAMNFDLLKLI